MSRLQEEKYFVGQFYIIYDKIAEKILFSSSSLLFLLQNIGLQISWKWNKCLLLKKQYGQTVHAPRSELALLGRTSLGNRLISRSSSFRNVM